MKQKIMIDKEMDTVDKLNHLITIVDKIPENQFDMNWWHEETECGTVGCALGWACLDPVFNEMGLEIVKTTPYHIIYKKLKPSFNGNIEYAAAMFFFDISMKEAVYLFHPDRYNIGEKITKEHVITRIKEVRDKYKNT